MDSKIKKAKRIRKHCRIRAKIKGTAARPRFSVFRSSKHLFVQLIDDEKNKTIVSASDQEIKSKADKKVSVQELGKLIAQKAVDKKIKKVVFDRGGYKYHGQIKALADAAREAGLEF